MFVIASIGILAILILVHEAGHFAAARLQGIYANRFSIGFGPILWSWKGSQTEYAVRALPLGGFVGFPDDDEDCPYAPDDPNLLRNRPVLDRAIVMAAGVLANLVFAYLVLMLMCGTVGIPTPPPFKPGLGLPAVTADSPAQQAGLQAEDIILEANGQNYRAVGDRRSAEGAIEQFRALVQDNPERPLELTVKRFGQEKPLAVSVTPILDTDGDRALIGVSLTPNQEIVFRHPKGIGEIVAAAADAYQRIVAINIQGFAQLFGNFQNTAGQISGPVGIVKIGADLAKNDSASLYNFTALISINLAIINILPLPALDGGHLLFLLLEAVRGKRLPKQLEERVMQTGLVLLLGLGVVLIFKDTLNLVVGAG
jgi:membrane-associated protease RseP (regulator of RpoE activity)